MGHQLSNRDATSVLGGQREDVLDAVDVRGEGGQHDASRRTLEMDAQRLPDVALRACMTGAVHVACVT